MIKRFRRAAAAAAAALALAAGGAAWAASSVSASTFPIGQCGPGNVAVWVNADGADHTAGTTFYHLEYTNVSNVTCFLWGYPGVLAATLGGKQLGHAAAHNDPATRKNVYLVAGATAHSVLGYVDAAVDSSCKPRTAAFLKVYVPGAFGPKRAFFSLPVCTTIKPVDLTVWRFQAGVLQVPWTAAGPRGHRAARPDSDLRQVLPNRSNSPFRTPPRNECHSSGVNAKTEPAASLLLRTPISPPGRSATSTQLPLAKLSELLTQT
jgi:hypothetical protein